MVTAGLPPDCRDRVRSAAIGNLGSISAAGTILSLSRKRRTTEGFVTPARRMAVVGFKSASAAKKPATTARVTSSLMPVPFGRPRRRGSSLISVCPSLRRPIRQLLPMAARGPSGHYPGADCRLISAEENRDYSLVVNGLGWQSSQEWRHRRAARSRIKPPRAMEEGSIEP